MKIYLSADIEGVTGIIHWDETEKKHPDYDEFRRQMTAEVAAACDGALAAGADEVLVKDAHDSARNILPDELPAATRLHRGWSGHPYMMMDGLDSTYAAVLMIGYHSRAGSGGNPLSHSMSTGLLHIKINGQFASEFMINAYIAGLAGVPVAFLSGDADLCKEACALVPGLTCVGVKEGQGAAAVSLHPQTAIDAIRIGVRQALSGDLAACRVRLPDQFSLEIAYRDHARAYWASFYPGARLLDPRTVLFEAENYLDALRVFSFAL